MRDTEGGEGDGLGEDAAHQELPVATFAGDVDGTAEHVGEQETNTIGWMVASLSASGWRLMCSRPRRAITQVSCSTPRGRGSGVDAHVRARCQ